MTKKVKEKMASEAVSPVTAEVAPVETVEEAKAKQPGKTVKTEFVVYKNDEPVRMYTADVHGENAGDLAEEYAKKIGGEVR